MMRKTMQKLCNEDLEKVKSNDYGVPSPNLEKPIKSRRYIKTAGQVSRNKNSPRTNTKRTDIASTLNATGKQIRPGTTYHISTPQNEAHSIDLITVQKQGKGEDEITVKYAQDTNFILTSTLRGGKEHEHKTSLSKITDEQNKEVINPYTEDQQPDK